MKKSFFKRIKIKKNVILRKKKNMKHLLLKKSSSRKRRLKSSIKLINLSKYIYG